MVYGDSNYLICKAGRYRSIIYIVIPLLLSAYTHLWNPTGFPGIWVVEGQYLQRAMYVLDGEGLHEPKNIYHHPYDHPYFGQIFLAGLLSIFGYPDSIGISSSDYTVINAHAIEKMYLVPKLIVGILAVIDTLLLFKITEKRYGKTVALIATVLFAVMPVTWFLRKIFLETLLLPLLLSSVLFAIYINMNYNDCNKLRNGFKEKRIIKIISLKTVSLVLLSGIFLGLCIFTKIPLFIMIPFIGYIIFKNTKNWKFLSLWIVPVILIPLIWPIHALSIGEFEMWIKDVKWNSQRDDLSTDRAVSSILINSLKYIFQIDPVFLISGIIGILYAFIKRDHFILLWVLPFLLFLFAINFVSFFHLIPVIPIFCISFAKLIVDVSNKIKNAKIKFITPFVIISGIGIFGLVGTTMLITLNVNLFYFNIYAFLVQYLLNENNSNLDDPEGNEITIIGRHWTRGFYWIPKFIFDLDVDYKKIDKYNDIPEQTTNEKFLFIVDKKLNRSLEKEKNLKEVTSYKTTIPIAMFLDKTFYYRDYPFPYTSMSANIPTTNWVQFRVSLVSK